MKKLKVTGSDSPETVEAVKEHMIVLADTGFHAEEGDPPNLKLCQRGEWNERMLIETVLSMLTTVSHLKRMVHRVWEYFRAHWAFSVGAFSVLVQWDGLEPNDDGFVRLSIAQFSLLENSTIGYYMEGKGGSTFFLAFNLIALQ